MKKSNYLWLVGAIATIIVAGCEYDEGFGLDSSWKHEGDADTTIVNPTDTIRDTMRIKGIFKFFSRLYETIDDSLVNYELNVNDGEKTMGSFELQRLFGVLNGSKKEVLVKSENKLNGVSYAAGNFNSNSEAWKSGSYWSGENVKGMVSFTMANDSVSANFVDTYYSSSATLAKDTMTVIFPSLNWTSSYALDSTSVYNRSVGDDLFKVKDFITTTTFVAEVNADFVKEGSVSKKSFEVRDTLSLMYFMEPDPEDAVIDTVAYGSVEKMNGVINGIGRWYERHTLLDSVLVKEQKQAFNATLTAENGEAVYASNANYQTIGNGWTGNGEATYDNDATNGAEPFANTYKVSADKGITMSFNGIDIIFTTECVLTEAGQKIGASELVNINNVHYDVYPYSNKVNGVYTVSCGNEKQSINLSATSNREIRVKAADQLTASVENQQFVGEFVAEGAKLSTKTYYNQWDYVEYNYGLEILRNNVKHNLNLSAEITGAAPFDVLSKDDLTKEYKITDIRKTSNESEKLEENGFRFERETRFFDVTVNNGQILKVKVITEKDLTPEVNLGYMSLVDVQNGGVETTVNGNTIVLKPAVKVLLQENYATIASKTQTRGAATVESKAYTISTEMVGKYQPSIDTVRVPDIKNNVPTVETYRIVDGDSTLIETESYNPYSSLTANNGNDVIAENYNFATTFNGVSNEFAASIQDGNFFITRASGDVKSTMNNGTLSADNEGKYTFDKVMTYKNGNDEFIFNGGVLFTISTEDITFAGEKTVEEITYNAYDYKTTFNMVYYVDSVKVAEKSAPVSRNILVAKKAEDAVIDTVAYGSVEKMNGVINGIGRWYERHTLLDSVLVKEQKQAFNAELKAENGEAVYASNANYQTIGNGWSGNGNVDYIDDATNGVNGETFANTYKVSADKGMTMSFGGIEVVFTTEMVITEAGQTIGSSELVNINNVHYDVYPYANKVNGVYTVSCGNEKQSVEMSATANREIRVKAADVITEGVENQSFVAEFVTEGNTLSTKTYYNQWDYATYNYGMETSRKGFKHNLNVTAEITGAEDFKVQDKSDLTKEYKITSITETADQTEQVEEDGVRIERTTRFFNATVNNGKTLQVKVITEKDLTKDINLGYMSLVDVKDGGLTSTVNGNEVTLKPAVKVLLQENYATIASKTQTRGAATVESKAYTISTEMVGTYTPQVDTVRVPKMKDNVPTVETYRVVDGDSTLIETESYNPYCSLTANNGNDVIAENYNFGTSFNGTSNESVKSIQDNHFFITRVSGDVTSTMSNGTHSADNEGKYTFDKVMTYKNGNDVFTFNGEVSFAISTEDITAAGEKTVNSITYNAYDYKTTFNMVYHVMSVKIATKSASVERDILIKKDVIDTVRVPKMKNNVPTVETYRVVNGDSTLIETESYNPYSSLTANNGNDVIAENYNFMTTFNGVSNEFAASIQDGNFFITRVSGDVTSTMNNGTVTEGNEGKYTFDKVITYKNGNDVFTFDGEVSFTISTEDITAAGEKTVEQIAYNAYDYKTTFNMVYHVMSVKVAEKSASVERDILIEKEVEDLVPGTILSLAVTAVPAHWTGSSFADGSNHQQAIKGLAIITTDGKGCFIPFAGADDTNTLMPSSAAISGANYVDGGYDASYNSGYYRDGQGWKPAVMTQNGAQILYYDHGQAVRSLTQKSLSTWSWRNGNYTASVGGYTFSVKDGVATVKYNDLLVAQFK